MHIFYIYILMMSLCTMRTVLQSAVDLYSGVHIPVTVVAEIAKI